MNLKPINKDELQALFDRFADIPNKNEIILLGAYQKRRDQAYGMGKTKYNPNFKFLHAYDEDGNVSQTIPTVKCVIKIPSDMRIGNDGLPYTTNIPLFTTDSGVQAVKDINESSDRELQYVICKGAVQNFYVTRHATPSSDMSGYINRWMTMYNGKYDEKLASQILQILRMSLDVENNVQLPMLNVWIHNIADGTDAARELEEDGQLVGINEANLTGLVYMPPSLRINADGVTGRLHFKMRVKRNDVGGQTVPIAQQAKDGYDIINVIYSGENAIRYFDEVKQGYPVSVMGSLENYKFVRRTLVNRIEQKELAELFDVDIWDEEVQSIVKFVEKANITETIPSYNILAKEIRTDYQNW